MKWWNLASGIAATAIVGLLVTGISLAEISANGQDRTSGPSSSVTTTLTPAERVVGNLDAAAYWQEQAFHDCVEMSSAVVIGALTGKAPTEAEITAWARAHSGYDPVKGTPGYKITAILDHWGVTASWPQAMTVTEMETALAGGAKIIVGVDAEALWGPQGYKVVDKGVSDHALVVDEIDEADASVVLTDTGIPTGARETVSLSTFVKAWDVSGDTVIEVER